MDFQVGVVGRFFSSIKCKKAIWGGELDSVDPCPYRVNFCAYFWDSAPCLLSITPDLSNSCFKSRMIKNDLSLQY